MKTYLIPIAALLFIPSWARADGYESYKDQPRATYSRAYTVQPVSWRCPPEFSRHECRRIRAEAELRRARRTRQVAVYTPRALRNVDPGPERVARNSRRCAGYVKVDGPARWTNGLAMGAARKEWRRAVRTTYGERYIDENFSPNFRVSQPRIVGDRGFAVRSTAQGLACAQE